MQLQPGETILIQGGAGGVAGFAIQLAKHIGARVITTASAANHAYVRDLGPDEVIDYNTTDFTKAVANCDAVFDTVGGDVAQTVGRGAAAGRPRRLHRVRPQAPKPARRCHVAAAAGRTRARRRSSASRAVSGRNDPRSRRHTLSPVARRARPIA